MVDYLTTTGIYEFILMSGHPKEVPGFKTISNSFDTFTWILTGISGLFFALFLFIVEVLWNLLKNYQITKHIAHTQAHEGKTLIH